MTKQRAGQRARAPTVFCRPRRRRGLPSLSSFESVCDARRLSALAPAPHADAGELVRVLGARGLGRDDLSPDSPVLAAPVSPELLLYYLRVVLVEPTPQLRARVRLRDVG